MTVVIAAGGTGGHLYPGLSLAEAFRVFDPTSRIIFIGTASGMEATLLPARGETFYAIQSAPWVGKSLKKRLMALGAIAKGLVQSLKLLRRLHPHVVVGIGGYAAGPVLLAAILMRWRRIVLEPNLMPGLTNRRLAPFVDRVVIAFEATRQFLRGHIECLGVPVRASLMRTLRRPVTRLTLLVLGGSQGAHQINRAMMEALPLLDQARVGIIHQTGQSDYERVAAAYAREAPTATVLPYIEDMASAYARADLVVSRAGAGTLAELAHVGLPAIFIPYPHAEMHQEKNAAVFVKAGAAVMIQDRDVTGTALAEQIMRLIKIPEHRLDMARAAFELGRPNAAGNIVKLCHELAGIDPYPLRESMSHE